MSTIASLATGVQLLSRWLFELLRLPARAVVVIDPLTGSLFAASRIMAAAADPLRRTLFDVPVAAGEDTTLVPYVSHLTAKEQLAAHIHIHLLFSPGQVRRAGLRQADFTPPNAGRLTFIPRFFPSSQEDTWTLLERQFPKASEREFNSAIALLEMEVCLRRSSCPGLSLHARPTDLSLEDSLSQDVVSIDPHPHFPQEMLVKIDNSSALDPEAASVPLPFPGASSEGSLKSSVIAWLTS